MTIRKQLTSTAMFHTPGLFRALQTDYRIKGKTRRRAIHILSDGYGLPVEEARGLLSGSIAVESMKLPAPSPTRCPKRPMPF